MLLKDILASWQHRTSPSHVAPRGCTKTRNGEMRNEKLEMETEMEMVVTKGTIMRLMIY